LPQENKEFCDLCIWNPLHDLFLVKWPKAKNYGSAVDSELMERIMPDIPMAKDTEIIVGAIAMNLQCELPVVALLGKKERKEVARSFSTMIPTQPRWAFST
jgi:hypothetical protein